MAPLNRRKGLPAPLQIVPPQDSHIALAHDSSASALSSAAEDSDFSPFHQPLSMSKRKNTKKLSLTLPSAASSSYSLNNPSEPQSAVDGAQSEFPRLCSSIRRSSVISLPTTSGPTSSLLHRKEEEGGSPTIPYIDGPVQVIPGIWLGSEDNARDWKGLVERGIRSILNVAKEVTSPFDSLAAQPLRSTASVPDLKSGKPSSESTYYPPHVPSGRPGMHYLKLQWSHGQKDLVNDGFQAGMAFCDAALTRGDGVLVHCQCGISRSATMVTALVMRAAAERSASVPPEVWDLKGMQGAYTFVKDKSKWIGPNMSLIYELLDYEKKLRTDSGSPGLSDGGSGATSEEEEWTRRRQMLDDIPSDNENVDRESSLVVQEARALDRAMEDRVVARRSSASSLTSAGSGLGMGPAWRNRYNPRRRAGSIASNMTNNSVISENLVEEEEEPELLGVGGGFDSERERRQSSDTFESSATNSPDDEVEATPRNVVYASNTFIPRPTTRFRVPPSAPAHKKTFDIPPPPLTATRSTFEFPLRPKPKPKRRPPPIGLPPVPSSPVTVVVAEQDSIPAPVQPTPGLMAPAPAPNQTLLHSPSQSLPNATEILRRPPLPHHSISLPKPGLRQRTESRRPVPPPLHLLRKSSAPESSMILPSATPHQTLFVFPPSPTLTTRTPSAVMLTTTPVASGARNGMVPFPTISTPKIATFRQHGRTRSFIGVGTPMAPTTAFTKVEARGYVGLQ
ncbi:Tyrosine-protein phosphatase pmp1 [Leucoagaricus sp. SymC.cos]|nr:Tyrosine-protein phosphatase pmp1 [Leucoagaricus sp. SymC.cos]